MLSTTGLIITLFTTGLPQMPSSFQRKGMQIIRNSTDMFRMMYVLCEPAIQELNISEAVDI